MENIENLKDYFESGYVRFEIIAKVNGKPMESLSDAFKQPFVLDKPLFIESINTHSRENEESKYTDTEVRFVMGVKKI